MKDTLCPNCGKKLSFNISGKYEKVYVPCQSCSVWIEYTKAEVEGLG